WKSDGARLGRQLIPGTGAVSLACGPGGLVAVGAVDGRIHLSQHRWGVGLPSNHVAYALPSSLAWSPEGEELAFGAPLGFWSANGRSARLVPEGLGCSRPTWSPDGKRV